MSKPTTTMKLSLSPYRLAAIGATAVVAIVTIASLFLIDSPMTERMRRMDERRLSDLQAISYGMDTFVLKNEKKLPDSLDALVKDRDLGYLENQTKDPETKQAYEYKKTGDKTYELCATFSLSNKDGKENESEYSYAYRPYGPAWDHDAGRQCFNMDVRDTGAEVEDIH